MTEVCQDNVHALELSVIMTLKRSPIRSGGKYFKVKYSKPREQSGDIPMNCFHPSPTLEYYN